MAETIIGSAPHHTERTVGGTTVVELYGEIDILAALTLTSCLDALTAASRPDLVVDLRAVTFIDCSGLGLLCRTRNRVMRRHGRLRLVTGGRFRHVLNGSGLTGAFETYEGLAEAVAAVAVGDLSAVVR